jgi:hypothetical protein
MYCASVRPSLASAYGQETNQFPKDDMELSDLGWRSFHAATVHASGSFCVGNFLDKIDEGSLNQTTAASWGSQGWLSPHHLSYKKAAPLLGPQFKEARW